MELLLKFQTNSEAETQALGKKLGSILQSGDIVCLNGDLGAGKTHLTSGAAEAMEINEYVTSPTFTVVNEYHGGRMPFYHFDVYRIASYDELIEIGFEEYLQKPGVFFIEWAEQIPEITQYYKERITEIRMIRRDDISPERRDIEVRRFGA